MPFPTKMVIKTGQRNYEVLKERVKQKKGVPWQMATFGPLGAFMVKDEDIRQRKQFEDAQAMRESSRMPRLPQLPGNQRDGSEVINILDMLKPTSPAKGPPLPDSWGISWPGFISRAIERIVTEGPLAPYKTVKNKGLKAEFKREIRLITGGKK